MSRVRRVADRREMDECVEEFIFRGYKVVSRGESRTRLKERDWGDPGAHLLLAALSAWWTFGLSNVLYAVYRYATSEEVLVVLDEGPRQ